MLLDCKANSANLVFRLLQQACEEVSSNRTVSFSWLNSYLVCGIWTSKHYIKTRVLCQKGRPKGNNYFLFVCVCVGVHAVAGMVSMCHVCIISVTILCFNQCRSTKGYTMLFTLTAIRRMWKATIRTASLGLRTPLCTYTKKKWCRLDNLLNGEQDICGQKAKGRKKTFVATLYIIFECSVLFS